MILSVAVIGVQVLVSDREYPDDVRLGLVASKESFVLLSVSLLAVP